MNVLIKVVEEYIAQGHSVIYKKRKDGGILITSIDGQKFSGKEGNKELRKRTGKSLSSAQQKQREAATQKRSSQIKKLTDTQTKQLRKLQRAWRKSGESGRIRKATFLYHAEKGDLGEYIENTRRYIEKLAQYGLIDAVASQIEQIAMNTTYIYQDEETGSMFEAAAQRLRELNGKITASDLLEVSNIIYTWDGYANTKDIATKIIKIISKYKVDTSYTVQI